MTREYAHGVYNIRNYARYVIAEDERKWQRFKKVWSVRIHGWFEKPVVFWTAVILGALAFFAIPLLPID